MNIHKNARLTLVAYYQSLGITVGRVLTDNGSCYKAFDFRDGCRDLGLRHIRTKPYTPKTNGKVERLDRAARMGLRQALQPLGPAKRRTPQMAACL